jgi:signal transduction histidine kinase
MKAVECRMQSILNIKERKTIGLFGMFLLGVIFPVIGIAITHFLLPEWKMSHQLLHSAMEVLGSFAALSLAALLLFMRKQDMNLASHVWLASGLLAMGILDGFHAIVAPDGPFVWLRCSSTLAGGFLFAVAWLPDRFARSRTADLAPVLTAVTVSIFGLASLSFPELIPAMISPQGYTPIAKLITTLGGLLFLASSPRYIRRYLAFGGFDLFLFASLSLLFGMAGISFGISKLWFADYWFWHLLRLVAYLHILYYMLRVYQQTFTELHRLTEYLEDRIEERTAQLSLEIAEHKQAEEDIRMYNEELLTINRVVTACTNIADLREILNRVLEESMRIVGLEEGSICLLGPDDTLGLISHRGACQANTTTYLTPHRLLMKDCLYGECLSELKPLILQDRESVRRFAAGKSGEKADIRFHAAFPLVTGRRKCVGVLCVFTGTDQKPSSRSLGLLETILAHVALLIENARLYEETLNHAATLEKKVQERTVELEEANYKLREIDRLKSMFIASMSHELRTPLNSVIGFSSILLNEWVGPLNEEQKENLSIVLRAGKHLLSLINDVIDVSKIEAGLIEINREEFELRDVITEAATSLGKEIENSGLEVHISSIRVKMHTDRRRLLQCVLNLLSNAVKYTEKGTISIVVNLVNGRIEQTNELAPGIERDFVEISVEDTGIGIREEDKPKIFEPFMRMDSRLLPNVHGTGLGLYLTRKLVTETLKGDITFTSEYGCGSRFVLHLPLLNPER